MASNSGLIVITHRNKPKHATFDTVICRKKLIAPINKRMTTELTSN